MSDSSTSPSKVFCVLALLFLICLVEFGSASAASQTAIKRRHHELSKQTGPSVVNLEDYGAVGDGVADDGPALQQALDALAVSGGGTLQIPAGHYRLVTPVIKHFSSDVVLTIEGAPSSTQIDVAGNGTGLDLTSEFIIAVGPQNDAITLQGLDSLLLKDVGFLGVQTVDTDARIVLSLSDIRQATVQHCEFYGLASLVAGGAILKADHTDLTLVETPFLGCAGNSGVSNSVVQNTSWLKVYIRDCKFIDYGNRGDFYSKTPLAPAYSWISVGDAADLEPSWSRREAIIDHVFMDEGVWLGMSARPDLFRPNYPAYSVQMSRLNVNVNNLHSSGVYIHGAQRVLIDRSHFGWSHQAGFAIYMSSVGDAILDLIDTSDDATRLSVSADRLSVINSVYTSLDSTGPVTQIITTDTPDEDPAQYVQQRYNNVLHHNADPAGYFYWTDKLLRCEANAQCLTQIQTALASFLAAAPPPVVSWSGHVVDKNGNALAGVKLSLSGFQSVATQTDASGSFSFGRLATAGEYQLTPAKDNCAFEKLQLVRPTADQATTITATLLQHSISGRVTGDDGKPLVAATLTLSGSKSGVMTSDVDGNYSFTNLDGGGNYTISAARSNYTIVPPSCSFSNLSANQTCNFQGTALKYTIDGQVKTGNGIAVNNALVSLSGGMVGTAYTDENGHYAFSVSGDRDYVIRVSSSGYAFTPSSRAFDDLSENQHADFTAAPGVVISGQVTTNGNLNLQGVLVSVSGSQSDSVLTDAGGNYALIVPSEGNYSLTAAKSNYTFTPASTNLGNISANQVVNFTASLIPGTPVLMATANNPTRALALDAVLRTVEPFDLNYMVPWGTDNRTRLILFATNFELLPGEGPSDVTVELEDAAHRVYPLTVEVVGPIPEAPSLMRLIVRLSDDLTDVGDVMLRIKYHGASSEPLLIGIGHLGTTPPN